MRTQNGKYVVILAVIAGAILTAGALLRPKKTPVMEVVPEQERVRLNRLLQERALQDISTYLADTAAAATSGVVGVERRSVSGLAWPGNGLIVTGSGGDPFPDLVTITAPADARMQAETVRAGPEALVVALKPETPGALKPVRLAGSVGLSNGQWLVTVWRGSGGKHTFSAGIYSGAAQSVCGESPFRELVVGTPLSAAMEGGGVFDANAGLVGIVIRCGARWAVMASEDVARALGAEQDARSRVLRHYGLIGETLDDRSRKVFGVKEGLLITDVWDGYPADDAGLRAGDVIIAAGGKPVQSIDDLAAASDKVDGLTVEVSRWRQKVTVDLSRTGKDKGPVGVVLDREIPGVRVDQVTEGGFAAEAGIRQGDRILRVGGEEVTSAAVWEKALARVRSAPQWVVIQRGTRRKGVWVGHE